MATEKLSALERQLLNFESRMTSRRPTSAEIRDVFDLTAARYYQLLWNLIDDPRAESAEPLLVHRLRRIRDRAASARGRA